MLRITTVLFSCSQRAYCIDSSLILFMKHLAAYLLLLLSGNNEPSASDIRELLKSVGSETDNSLAAADQ